ncbi:MULTISPECIES: FAD:protein FMN transferase [Nocardiaceae]|uniref:FAD:protein FMN transferase n=1 Tax=Nocardiaceae TaxID=85025 RepID=UPI00055A0F82|nr:MULTISPECIES: FAD:protein FMN transferase [Rhodococcus]OZF06330.1 thiamine biosynthesis protein [Rhodococcus sp. 15-1189-1-1a]OZF21099.1 thiamine biosynthesis protein [Rhodococcus sp. 14-2686-1-2]OZF57597.1 thiamine biosynthesis protein [Rhodococcus sp. 14-2470-1b]
MTTLELGESSWDVWSTTAHLIVTDSRSTDLAESLVRTELTSIELACSRFRKDSELSQLATSKGRPTALSPMLTEFVAAALRAAELTDGAVDPTVGSALIARGYDRDFTELGNGRAPISSAIASAVMTRRADWTMVTFDDGLITVPEGVVLDLGATAKAVAADRCADLVSATLGCGVLVSLGGDVATRGHTPDGGWHIQVCDGDNEPSTVVSVGSGTGVATSSTVRRRWAHAGRTMHHILDPEIGWPVDPYWRTVTVVADSCVQANTVSTACIVKGSGALPWLERVGLPARLVSADSSVTQTRQWPDDSKAA